LFTKRLVQQRVMNNKRTALYISSNPPCPEDYGNRRRIKQTLNILKKGKFDIDFVFYPIDSDWMNEIPIDKLSENFEVNNVYIAPPLKTLHQKSKGDHHLIDEWWDQSLEHMLKFLSKRKKYDVVFVNYIYLSKAFLFFPQAYKIIDTHDKFSGRKELFIENGLQPEFFYTNAQTEIDALKRANLVIAIKDNEAKYFQNVLEGNPEVINLPFVAGEFKNKAVTKNKFINFGFIGAHNSVNSKNIINFLEKFNEYYKLYYPSLKIIIAGNVCKVLPDYNFIEKRGYVENVENFYNEVDCIISPIFFSTGLKIKVIEGLSFGLPMLATIDSFDGVVPFDDFHQISTIEKFIEAIVLLTYDNKRLKKLSENSRLAYINLEKEKEISVEYLTSKIKSATNNVLIFKDKNVSKSKFSAFAVDQAIEILKSKYKCIIKEIDLSELENEINSSNNLEYKKNKVVFTASKIALKQNTLTFQVNPEENSDIKCSMLTESGNISLEIPFLRYYYDSINVIKTESDKFIIYHDEDCENLAHLAKKNLGKIGKEINIKCIDKSLSYFYDALCSSANRFVLIITANQLLIRTVNVFSIHLRAKIHILNTRNNEELLLARNGIYKTSSLYERIKLCSFYIVNPDGSAVSHGDAGWSDVWGIDL